MANKIFDPAKFIHSTIILDASVLLKPFLLEDGHEKVNELISLANQKHLTVLATHLLIFEFLNILSKQISEPVIVEKFLQQFYRFSIGMIDPDHRHIKHAVKIACDNPQISYYDASYHALAKDMDATFLTADKKYYDATKHLGHVELFS